MKHWNADDGDSVLVETAWERQMNMAGVEAYEKSRLTAKGDLRETSTTITGQKVLRKFLERSSEAIQRMQKEVLGITSRTPRNLRATVLMIPEETASLLTLRALLDRTYGVPDIERGYNFQILCKEVSKAVELELNFRHWLKESEKQAKDYAKQMGWKKVPKSLAERLIDERGVSRSQIMKWRMTFEELNEYQWDTLEYHYCGEALITAVVEELKEVFEIHVVMEKGKAMKMVKMLPGFRKQFDDMEFKVSQMQVIRKPMIAKPRRWVKEEE